MSPSAELQAFYATTCLIHDLANATGSYPLFPANIHPHTRLARLLIAMSTFFVRLDELVAVAARLSSESEDQVEVEFLVASHALGSQDVSHTPPQQGLSFLDILELHSRNLSFREYGSLIHSFIQAYLWNAQDQDKLIDIKVAFCACVYLNSVPALIRKFDLENPNITLLMRVLVQDYVHLDALNHPEPALDDDIVLLQLLTSELWTTPEGEFVPSLLEELSIYCEEGNVAPDYHLWTISHWQQFAKCVYLLLSRLHESLFVMADISALANVGFINDDLASALASAYGKLEADYRIIRQLHRSAVFSNFLLMVEATLATDFVDPLSTPNHRSTSTAASQTTFGDRVGSSWSPVVLFYIRWLEAQTLHFEACATLDYYYTHRVSESRDVSQAPVVKLVFQYLPVPSLPSPHAHLGADFDYNAFVDSLFESRSRDVHEVCIVEAVKTIVRYSRVHRVSIHPAIHIAVTISHFINSCFSSDYYPEIGTSAYCCNHCFSCVSRMGFRLHGPDNNGPRVSPLSDLLPPIYLSPLYSSQMVGTLVQYLHTPLKLHLSSIIHRHRQLGNRDTAS